MAVWIFRSGRELLSRTEQERVDNDRLAVSPMVLLEMTYLRQVGRLTYDAPEILASLHNELGITVDPTPFVDVVEQAQACVWTRDPFDRIIAGQALAAGARLLTRDEVIREHVPTAVW